MEWVKFEWTRIFKLCMNGLRHDGDCTNRIVLLACLNSELYLPVSSEW